MRTKQYIKEINKYSATLSKENQDKFNEILLKLRFAKIDNYEAEEFSHHCLDLFLQAEETNTPVEELLATDDINAFCEEFIFESQSGYSFLKKLYCKINYLPMILFIFTGIFEMLIGYLLKAWVHKQALLTVPVTLSMAVNTLIAICVTYILFNKTYYLYKIFNCGDKKKDRLATIMLWLAFCMLTAIFILTKLFLPQVLFSLNYLIFMSVLGVVLIIQHLLNNRNQ